MNNKWWGIRLRSMETIRRKLIQRRIKTLVFWMKSIFMIVMKRIFCLCILLYNWQILIHCNDTNSNNDRLSVGFSLSVFLCRIFHVGLTLSEFLLYITQFLKNRKFQFFMNYSNSQLVSFLIIKLWSYNHFLFIWFFIMFELIITIIIVIIVVHSLFHFVYFLLFS